MELNWKKYQRQTILPGFGLTQQKLLFNSKVLVIGAGGLGCPALLYLAAAGVGSIGIIDFDTVEVSNLHRQILFNENDIGKQKAIVASEKIKASFPDCHLDVFPFELTEDNVEEIIQNFDVIIDGSDNFPTRYLVNDTCVKLNKPLVYGSVSRFEGQVAVFNFADARGIKTNYRDLFPLPPDEGSILNCAEAGVLGILPGIIGMLQANEAIKIISGIGVPLANKILTFNSLNNQFYEIEFKPEKENTKESEIINDASYLSELRSDLNEIDAHLLQLLRKRKAIVSKISVVKKNLNIPVIQREYWEETLQKRLLENKNLGMNEQFIKDIFNRIHLESIEEQEKYHDRK